MAANVETMFVAGKPAWHGQGINIAEAVGSEEALKIAGLDWVVKKQPVYYSVDDAMVQIPNIKVTVRDTDSTIFGTVSDRYKVVQNKEAFAFTDLLLNNDMGIPVVYESAGALGNGSRVWMLAKLPTYNILDDAVEPYIVFTNTFDGKGSVKVAMTPTRVVCQNTLTLAMKTATRTWSTRHTGDLETKIRDAQDTLQLATTYMIALNEHANKLQDLKLSVNQAYDLISQVLPFNELETDRASMNILEERNAILDIFSSKDDLKKFGGSGWSLYNAMADYESHIGPRRASPTFNERKFIGFIDGNRKLEQLEQLLTA